MAFLAFSPSLSAPINTLSPWLIGGLLLLATRSAQAQDPGSGGPQPGTPDPTAGPLDGGASLLLAAGAGLGLRYLRPRKP